MPVRLDTNALAEADAYIQSAAQVKDPDTIVTQNPQETLSVVQAASTHSQETTSTSSASLSEPDHGDEQDNLLT